MVTARPRALALLVLTVLGLSLALVLGTRADAATTNAPAPGTDECAALIAEVPQVVSARLDVSVAQKAVDDATTNLDEGIADGLTAALLAPLRTALNNATSDLGSANAQLKIALGSATSALCPGSPVNEPGPSDEPTPTTTPTTTTATPGAPTVTSVLGLIAGLDCTDFNAKLATIQSQSFELAKSGASPVDQGRIADALNARIAALGSCVAAPTMVVPGATSTETITPGSGSTVIGGTQVTVPNTSAGVDTGGW